MPLASQDELQRRYRMMEADRKLYADEVQNVVRKQKAQIEKLKRENTQLKSELQLQQRASTVGDGSVASVKVTRMQDSTDSITRAIELERRRSEELDNRTKAVREGILAERRDMGGNNAPQEQNQAIGKQIRVLEHRLHRALVKFNEAIAANKDLREEIDNLRRERVVFDGIYKKLQHELAEKKKRMAEIIEVANVAYEQRDRAQTEIGQLKLQAEKEQQEFESEWKELGRKLEEDRKRQDFLARERQRMLENEKRGEMTKEDEAELKKVVTKGHWKLAGDKATIHAGMEKVQSYEEAFAKIQAETVRAAPIAPTARRRARRLPARPARPARRPPRPPRAEPHPARSPASAGYLGHRRAGEAVHRERGPELQDVQLPQRAHVGDREGRRGAGRAEAGVGQVQGRRQGGGESAEAAGEGPAGESGGGRGEDEGARRVQQAHDGDDRAGEPIDRGLCAKLGANTTLLQEMGAEGGANESNLMVYLGVLEQRANELLSATSRSAAAAATAAATTSRARRRRRAARGAAHAAGRRRRLDRGADDGRRVRE